jgi:hypothetical protein
MVARALAQVGNNQSEFARIITEAAYELDNERGTTFPSAVNRWLTGTTPQPRMQRWIAHALNNAASTSRWRRSGLPLTNSA